MSRFLIFVYSLLGFLANAQKKPLAASQAINGFAVVELFTSAANAICPPADSLAMKLITEAAKNKEPVYVLAFHVDYWNRFGWHDPYSKLAYSNRQKDYMFKLQLKEMSIPQFVVNGNKTFAGLQESNIRKAVRNALTIKPVVQLAITKDSIARDTLFISYKTSGTDKNYYLRIAVSEKGIITRPTAGDTKGLTQLHANVVRAFYSGNMEFVSGQVKVPLRKFSGNKMCNITAFVQHKKTSAVLGATSIIW